jgi:hypothetical protein
MKFQQPDPDQPMQDFVGPILRAGYENLCTKMRAAGRIPAPGSQVEMEFHDDGTFTLSVQTVPAPTTE